MNAKNKAQELVNNFINIMARFSNKKISVLSKHAKECAMILCVEIINSILSIIGTQTYMWSCSEKETVKFWEDVKKEITIYKK